MSSENVKGELGVLVVDDSVVYRKILKEVISVISGATLIGTAANGRIGLEKLRNLNPDLVLLDVEMPEKDGLETLKEIRENRPDIGVVMVSGAGRHAADVTVAALEMGALDFITKPAGDSAAVNQQSLVDRLSPIIMNFATKRALTKVRMHHEAIAGKQRSLPAAAPLSEPAFSREPPPPVSREPDARPVLSNRVEVVTIGVSTGGPNALGMVIPRLPENLGVPVLVVQHMPPVFTASLAGSLNRKSRLPVMEAREGDLIEANHVYIAPGGFHMVIRRKEDSRPVVGLNENPPENSCRPAVDVLFRSVATIYGGNVLAVIMTGMGQDGLNGVRMLKQRGAYCLIQDEATSTIFGMPLAVMRAGLADETLPLQQLAGRITTLAAKSS
jgi:two-component system, chemotaxis family, protein-glutamate methylesterase/glutaminase